MAHKDIKRYIRKILSRESFKTGTSRAGTYWIAQLECGHEARLGAQRGPIAKQVHCEKCYLGLVRAGPEDE